MSIQRFTPAALAASARLSATGNGSAVDVSRYTGLAKFILSSSATEGAGQTADFKVQQSDDGSTGWADVPGLSFTQVTNAAASLQAIDYNTDRLKKFVRVVSTLAGSTPFVTRAVTLVGKLAY